MLLPAALVGEIDDTVPDAAANNKAKETRLTDFHMAEIKKYGPWIEFLWEGVDCTVVEIERKEQDNDGNDMDVVEENEDNAANQSPRFQQADKLFEFLDGSQV